MPGSCPSVPSGLRGTRKQRASLRCNQATDQPVSSVANCPSPRSGRQRAARRGVEPGGTSLGGIRQHVVVSSAPTSACGPSSSKLKTDIANFMERADELAEHPLAAHQPAFTVIMMRDPESTLVTAMNFDWNNMDKSTWVYCAVLMRPMVFLAGDDIALGALLDRIGAEHPPLANYAERGKRFFEAWQTHMYVGQQNLRQVPTEHQGLPTGTVTRLELGPPDTVPDDVDLDKMVPDYQLAKIYFNGMLWHSDTKKAAKFEAASSQMRAFYAKCAEIRTITAFEHVRGVRQLVHQARNLGHDL